MARIRKSSAEIIKDGAVEEIMSCYKMQQRPRNTLLPFIRQKARIKDNGDGEHHAHDQGNKRLENKAYVKHLYLIGGLITFIHIHIYYKVKKIITYILC